MILDIYSRYVVGWMVAPKETAALAQRLVKSTYKKQGVKKGAIILHADRGSPMIAKTNLDDFPLPYLQRFRNSALFDSQIFQRTLWPPGILPATTLS